MRDCKCLLTSPVNGFPGDSLCKPNCVNRGINALVILFGHIQALQHHCTGSLADHPTVCVLIKAQGLLSGVNLVPLISPQYTFHPACQIHRTYYNRFDLTALKKHLGDLQRLKNGVFLRGYGKGRAGKIPQ
ncbi:hypothetical protein ES703_88494 [subsurface metagenome]